MNTVPKVAAFVICRRPHSASELLLFTHQAHPEFPLELPGGGIDPGETPDEAVRRELYEEAGLKNLPFIRKLGVSEVWWRSEFRERHCYLFDGSGLPDSWVHEVTGSGHDRAKRFVYRWQPIVPGFRLGYDLGAFFNATDIPELFATTTGRPISPFPPQPLPATPPAMARIAGRSLRVARPWHPTDWNAYHAIRRDVLWTARGHASYRDDHPDETAEGNFPLLYVVEGSPLGVLRADLRPKNAEATFRRVAIAREHQRKGHGTALMEQAEAFALYAGCTRFVVNASPGAVPFYLRLGYALDPTSPEHDPRNPRMIKSTQSPSGRASS